MPVTAFVGSPANCWSHWFEFPPRPREIGGCPIPDVLDVSLALLLLLDTSAVLHLAAEGAAVLLAPRVEPRLALCARQLSDGRRAV
ncbi:hypothetical protein EBR56_05480 [bacterium]|nr:hypothetical protein [bacterium]